MSSTSQNMESGIVAYCKKCGGLKTKASKIIIPNKLDWEHYENGEEKESGMGVETMHAGEYKASCPLCHEIVEATFYTSEYPVGSFTDLEPQLVNLEFEDKNAKFSYRRDSI